jgi:hypothetical protein
MNALLEQLTVAQLTAAARGIALYALGALVTNGYITNDESQVAAGLFAGVVVLGFGIWKRRRNGIITTASNMKGVEEIVTDEKTADKIPSPKVVSRHRAKPVPPLASN